MTVQIDKILDLVVSKGASDLHITAGSPPQMRVHGSLYPVPGFGVLRPGETRMRVGIDGGHSQTKTHC